MTRPCAPGAIAQRTQRADLAASTEAAIVDVLVAKTLRALKETGLRGWWWPAASAPTGGCERNWMPRAARRGWQVHYPPVALCTDNGAMIALAAALRAAGRAGRHAAACGAFDVRPRWPLDSRRRACLTFGNPPCGR
jgi:N6-L-threonylcarbamoyladenine synthase